MRFGELRRASATQTEKLAFFSGTMYRAILTEETNGEHTSEPVSDRRKEVEVVHFLWVEGL